MLNENLSTLRKLHKLSQEYVADYVGVSVKEVLANPSYKHNAAKIAESFYRCGDVGVAADFIEKTAASN